MKKILVTGSDGYIGSVLIRLLLDKGYAVTGLDSLFFQDLYLGSHNLSYELINKDIRETKTLDLSGFDTIIHLAALSNDPLGKISPKLTQEINFLATVKFAQKAKKSGIKRFIFSSSCSIYGITEKDIVDEQSKVNPLTEYAKSKIDSEKELKKIADKNFCIVLLRNSTVYGYSPKFRDDLVVNNLTACAYTKGEIKILSDGTPWRPLIDVRDLASIFMEFIDLDSTLINAEIFNIGFDENNFQVKDIANFIQKHLPKSQIIYAKKYGKDSRSYRVSFKKFQSLFPKFKQKWPLSKSIQNLIKKMDKYGFSNQDFSNGKFNRLAALNNLLREKRVNEKLFRIN